MSDIDVHFDLEIGRPDGSTWVSVKEWVTKCEIELGNVDAVGTGTSGADGVVRTMNFELINDSAQGSFHPRDRNSAWNLFDDGGGAEYTPLLFPMREVMVKVAVGAEQESGSTSIIGEAVGTGDGSTTVFSLDNTPVLADSDTVYLDGTDTTAYTIDEDAGEITFNAAPGVGVLITADYTYWKYIFHGYLGDSIRTNGYNTRVTVECRDLAKRILNTYIEREFDVGEGIWVPQKYPKSEADEPVEDVLQDILDDNNLSDVIIYTPSGTAVTPIDPTESPFWDVPWDEEEPLAPANASVWDVLQGIVSRFGWFLGYRWHEPTEQFQLVLMEPPRTKSAGDITLGYNDDFNAQDLDITDRDIRNAVAVNYNDTDGVRRSLTVIDQESIDTYGRRAMEIELEDTDLIRTEANATTLGEAAVHDLSSQSATTRINMLLLPSVDVFTGIEVVNNLVSTTTDFFGVESVRHLLVFDGQPRCRTEVVASGQVTGGHRKWLKMETRPGSKTPSDPGTPENVTGLALSELGDLLKDGTYVPIIHAEWTRPSDKLFARALVYYRETAGEWIYVGSTKEEEFEIRLMETGTYDVRVVSESVSDEQGDFTTSPTETITVEAKTVFDLSLEWDDCEWMPNEIIMRWKPHPIEDHPDFDGYELRLNTYFGEE